jgi:hypothetical protein
VVQIVPADEDIIPPDIGAIQQPEPVPDLAIEDGGAPTVNDDGLILADQDNPIAMPAVSNENPLPLAPAVVPDRVVAQDPVPQEPSELQRSIRESFRRTPLATVLNISVKAALRDHPTTAKITITAELKQMLSIKVWTPVHIIELTAVEKVVQINKFLLDIIIELDRSFANYTCPDVGCIDRLDKALYSCIESAALWGDHIMTALVDMK